MLMCPDPLFIADAVAVGPAVQTISEITVDREGCVSKEGGL